MPALAQVKLLKRGIVDRHARPNDLLGLAQVLTTLLPLAGLWVVVAQTPAWPYLVPVFATLLMSLLLLRSFVLMHECGHASLFRTPALNSVFGFCLGVLTGMPQYVWAQHHNFHHATNGNWAKYRGPLATLSVDEYDALSPQQQRAYVRDRHVRMALLAGFLYVLFNPRLNWIKGSLRLIGHLLRGKIRQPAIALRVHAAQFKTPYWKSSAEYWHMTGNNLVLFGLWVLMCGLLEPLLFIPVYVVSTSLAGGAGIVLFTVQHNFEHSHATGDAGWCYDTAALDGTSYLVLPSWLNWVTANIGYHHIHHLSARIPNYRLAQCHAEHAPLFTQVRRLSLDDVVPALQFLLWCPRSQRIISVAEHQAAKLAAG